MPWQIQNFVSVPALCILTACAASEAPPAVDPAKAGLTPAQAAAYEQCLHDRQAVAMSWKIIKEQCRQEAIGSAKARPPTS